MYSHSQKKKLQKKTMGKYYIVESLQNPQQSPFTFIIIRKPTVLAHR